MVWLWGVFVDLSWGDTGMVLGLGFRGTMLVLRVLALLF